jgi:hypothetical protein
MPLVLISLMVGKYQAYITPLKKGNHDSTTQAYYDILY